jgi:hypothetical protein
MMAVEKSMTVAVNLDLMGLVSFALEWWLLLLGEPRFLCGHGALDALLFHGFEDAGGGAVIVIDDGIHRDGFFAYVDTVGADLLREYQSHDPILPIKYASVACLVPISRLPMLDPRDLGEIDDPCAAEHIPIHDAVFLDVDAPVEREEEQAYADQAKQGQKRDEKQEIQKLGFLPIIGAEHFGYEPAAGDGDAHSYDAKNAGKTKLIRRYPLGMVLLKNCGDENQDTPKNQRNENKLPIHS